MSDRYRVILCQIAIWIALLSGCVTAVVLATGGFDTRALGFRIAAHDPLRSIAITLLALGGAFWATGRAGSFRIAEITANSIVAAVPRIPSITVAIGLSIAVAAAGVVFTSRVAGGSDSYGYLSQAELWLKGQRIIAQPWVLQMPWPGAQYSFVPLAYAPGVIEGTIVPTYPPGLPIIMAIVKAAVGMCGVFWISPVTGGLLVLATYGTGLRVANARLALIAAWLTATSPVLIFSIMQPMSDVPVGTAWALSLWAVLGTSLTSAFAAGLFAAVAILIRPNLVPIAIVIGVWLALTGLRAKPGERAGVLIRLTIFAGLTVPAVLAIAWLNQSLHGSWDRSGYGTVGDLFGLSNVLTNAARYSGWFFETQTIVGAAGVVALVVALPCRWFPQAARRPPLLLALMVVAVFAEYCAYFVFDQWSYLRFFLPVWPPLMIGSAAVIVGAFRRNNQMWALIVVILTIALGLRGVRTATDRYAFDWKRGEQKFQAVAMAVQRLTPENSVIISLQHSGSIRYYSGRITFGFATLDPLWLDRATDFLAAHGAHPYAVLEDWEVREFRARFAAHSVLGRLDMTPIARYKSASASETFIYDLLMPPGSKREVELINHRDITSCPHPAPPATLILK